MLIHNWDWQKLCAYIFPEVADLNRVVVYGVVIYALSPYILNPIYKNPRASSFLQIRNYQLPNVLTPPDPEENLGFDVPISSIILLSSTVARGLLNWVSLEVWIASLCDRICSCTCAIMCGWVGLLYSVYTIITCAQCIWPGHMCSTDQW